MFTVHIEACHVGLGGAFTQKDAQRNDRILAYGNRTLHTPERNFLTLKKDCLVVFCALNTSLDVMYFQIFTCYCALKWLKNRRSCKADFDYTEMYFHEGKKAELQSHI